MAETIDLGGIAYSRWKRAVDLLLREVIRRRLHRLEAEERARAERRVKNLRRIVRRALSEYSRIQRERSLKPQASRLESEA